MLDCRNGAWTDLGGRQSCEGSRLGLAHADHRGCGARVGLCGALRFQQRAGADANGHRGDNDRDDANDEARVTARRFVRRRLGFPSCHVDPGREVHNLCLQDRALVIVEGPALQADRVRTHARVGRGVGLEFESHHAGGVLDRGRGGQGDILQSRAGGREVVLLAQQVVVLENGLDEGLEGSGRLRVRRSLVLLDVHVAHQHDGPGVVAGHVVDVDTAPISRGINREVSNALVARFGHAAERDGLLGAPGLAVEVCERHLRNVEVVAVAGVQVADGVHFVLEE
mmetsp:Transcript_104906/g.266419  ORF Transcript_104906/g.266419 Transcript_104906/m.266419 type:complete len:283 (+) Transcript_104906:98-946(+)